MRPDQQGPDDAVAEQPGTDPADTTRATPPGSAPDTAAEGVDPNPEVPGGPQTDLPAGGAEG